MIVYTKDDMLRLSGALVKNQWLTIKAAASLLLRDHPQGIIIDCGELEHVSADGAKTFLEAMRDIQAAGSRIVVANLPEEVLKVVRSVPGVRSQLPVAHSVEEARASLLLGTHPKAGEGERGGAAGAVLVPLLEGTDVEHALMVAARIARETRQPIDLVYLLVVARNLPLGTPLPEMETAAHTALESAAQLAKRDNVLVRQSVERVRDAEEGLLQVARNNRATHVIVSAAPDRIDEVGFLGLVDLLLHRCQCSVVAGRRAMPVDGR